MQKHTFFILHGEMPIYESNLYSCYLVVNFLLIFLTNSTVVSEVKLTPIGVDEKVKVF